MKVTIPVPVGWVHAATFPKSKYVIVEYVDEWRIYHEDDHGAFS